MDPTIKVWLVQAANLLIWLSDLVTDLLFGYTFARGTRKERELARRSFEHSAQVVSVVWMATHTPAWPIDLTTHHVFRHEKYVDPRVILEQERICLSHMTKSHAYFGIARPGTDFYSTKEKPFLITAIIDYSDQYIVLPMSTFHRLAEEAGDPKVDLSLFGLTIRSGSTLVAQVMNRVPDTRSLSEPCSFNCATLLHHWGEIDIMEAREMMRSSMRLHAKLEPGSTMKRLSIKIDCYPQLHFDMLHELFPKMKFIMSVRHPLPSVKSFRKLHSVFSDGGKNLYLKLGMYWRYQLQPMCYPSAEKYASEVARLNPHWQTISDDEASAMFYSACLSCFNEFRHIFQQVILYEDLVSDPEGVIGKLFKLLNLGEDLVPLGVSALGLDSQKGMMNVQVKQEISPKLKNEIDKCLRNAHLPISCDTSLQDFRHFLQL